MELAASLDVRQSRRLGRHESRAESKLLAEPDAFWLLSSPRASGQLFALDARDGRVLWLGEPRFATIVAFAKAGDLMSCSMRGTRASCVEGWMVPAAQRTRIWRLTLCIQR
jgi:hypothetical protein